MYAQCEKKIWRIALIPEMTLNKHDEGYYGKDPEKTQTTAANLVPLS